MTDDRRTGEHEGAGAAAPSDFRAIFDLVNDGLFVHEIPTGAILDANRRAEQMYGLSRDELRRSTVAELSDGRPPYSQRDALALIARTAAGEPQVFEWHARRRSGERFWVEVNLNRVRLGGADRLLAVVRDITERKASGEGLREQEAFATRILESSLNGIYIIDLDVPGPVFVNARYTQLTGYTLEDLRALDGDLIETLFHPEDQGPMRARLAALASARDGEVLDVEYRFRARDGRWLWCLSRETPFARGPDGHVRQLIGTFMDLTEHKRVEQELRDADRRKSEFLGVLSHELRNPLAPIRNSLYLLTNAPPDSATAARARSVLLRQTEHLTRLVDDLLDVTRISRGKVSLRLSRIDARALVLGVCDDHRSLVESKGVELGTEVGDGPAWVDADPTRLEQILENLLQNSAKFTPSGGRVVVALRVVEGRLELRVRDTGIGIDPAEVDRMFEPFAQAEGGLARTSGGLGLGLALVKGLVQLHGGTVAATSEGLGRGTEVVVTLPLAVAPPAQAPASGGVNAE